MDDVTPLHDVLHKAGAVFQADGGGGMPLHFGNATAEYEAARNHVVVFDGCACSKVALAGPDAALFLHNLCTNDVTGLAVGAGCEAFLATHKARVVAHLGVSRVRWQGSEEIWLDAAPGHAERIFQHLNHFLISEQVELSERTHELAMLRVLGPAAATIVGQALQAASAPVPPWHHIVRAGPGGDVVVRFHRALGALGYDCFCAPALAPALWDRIVHAGAKPMGTQAHEILRIEAGFPAFGAELDDNRFVVEVGRTDAISYTKGCYLGQEPIVMARDRGQANRLLLGLLAGPGEALAAGTGLFHEGAEAGQVTSSAWSPHLKQVVALAYVRRGHQKPGTELTVAPPEAGRKAAVSLLPIAPVYEL